MKHYMRLSDVIFDEVKSEAKGVETRLFDKKREMVSIGDTIIFRRLSNLSEEVNVWVVDIGIYKTWKDLVEDTPIGLFGPRWNSAGELVNAGSGYSQEK